MHRLALLFALVAPACKDVEDEHDHDHENEVITTVELTFTPAGGGTALSFMWSDPEDDGSPVIDPIGLAAGTSWDVSVAFWNALETPAEDLTPEVADEAEEHQVFFVGSAVRGPATGAAPDAVLQHAYADEDAGGLPVGLENTIDALAAGTGTLTLVLRHLPEEGGAAVKVAGLAESVASDGFGAIGGDDDVRVDFPVEVAAP